MTMPNPSRRILLAAALFSPLLAHAQQSAIPIDVWKTPSCNCCNDWIKHIEANGFKANIHVVDDTGPILANAGIPEYYSSCHTAVVQGYAIVGHVPAHDIHRLLREKPQAAGLTNPGMPLGSPGMDGPEYQGSKHPYEVLLVRRDGSAHVFQSYR